jgi:tRNA-specific 2-thiouridylase
VADVDDARRVADRLDIDHHVFNFGDDFEAKVIDPYVDDHVAGRTPNPCIECNRHLKFDRLFARASDLGFETVATGHHARVVERDDGRWALARGADAVKDQSYVLSMLDQATLARTLFPVGDLTKEAVRDEARRMGLRTADKPDSQDVCFITSTQGRSGFLAERIDPTPADVVDPSGAVKGRVDAVELVTIGQRRGLGLAGGTPPRFVTDVRPASSTSSAQVTIGRPSIRARQQPHWPWGWQPSLVEVTPQRSRRVSSRDSPGTGSTSTGLPFSVRRIDGILA